MPASPSTNDLTLEHLASLLDRQTALGQTLTYREAAQALDLKPPQSIHQLTVMLERLMERDAAASRPLRAALVVSRVRDGRPAPGFFDKAYELGVFNGENADGFHDRLLEKLCSGDKHGDRGGTG